MSPAGPISLSAIDLTIAAALILLNGGISLMMSLGMERRILVAAARMVGQLLAIGLVLEWVFELERAAGVIAVALVMGLLAGREAVARQQYRFRGIYPLGWGIMLGSSFLVTGTALVAIIDAQPWYLPQYAIPLIGMVLGNTLNGIALGLERILSGLHRDQGHIELLLSLGASRREALQDLAREAVRVGRPLLTPCLWPASSACQE